MTVENIPFSFVQMEDPATVGVPSCEGSDYPVMFGNDVRFQFIMEAANATELGYLTANHAVRLYYNGARHDSVVMWQFLNLGNNRVLIYLPDDVPEIDALPAGQCFRFAFLYFNEAPTPYSDCFVKLDSDKGTTKIEYSNTVDQNGFYYCDVPEYQNSMRLPMQISDITYEGQDNIYRFSDGRQYNPAAYRNKILNFQTDWMDYKTLDYLQAALLSRHISITSDMYEGEMVSTGAIEPEFNDSISNMRKTPRATFSAYATPYNMALNSCTTCSD